MKDPEIINICQVSLKRDIPLIQKNYFNFKKYYKNLKIFIICPSKELSYFEKNLNYNEFEIIDENKILPIKEFKNIFLNLKIKLIIF